jgi:hypothetical protein
MYVRIISTPPGEAPEEVRRAWVGLSLPVLDEDSRPRTWRTIGVVAGPKTFLSSLVAVLSGRTRPVEGFRVNSAAAIRLLEAHDATAAAWWRANAPHYCRPTSRFVFHAAVCSVVREAG